MISFLRFITLRQKAVVYYGPREGGRLYEMKVKRSCSFWQSYYERLVQSNVLSTLFSVVRSAYGQTLPIIKKGVIFPLIPLYNKNRMNKITGSNDSNYGTPIE